MNWESNWDIEVEERILVWTLSAANGEQKIRHTVSFAYFFQLHIILVTMRWSGPELFSESVMRCMMEPE